MATSEEIAALNVVGVLVPWTPYVGRTPCPRCGRLHTTELRQVYRVRPPGDWSLAGVQLKYPAEIGWEYRCTSCGDTGPTVID